MEIKLEHVLLFLLFVLFLKMIRDKCGCNRVVEGVGARPRKAAPANQPPKKHTTPPPPDTGDFVNFTSEGWSYNDPIDTFASSSLAQCNASGTGGEVLACLTNATNTSGKQCENFYTKTVGGKGGIINVKPSGSRTSGVGLAARLLILVFHLIHVVNQLDLVVTELLV